MQQTGQPAEQTASNDDDGSSPLIPILIAVAVLGGDLRRCGDDARQAQAPAGSRLAQGELSHVER